MPHKPRHYDGNGIHVEQLTELKSAALEADASAIVITDREGIIVWVNPAFHQLTGYSSEEVIGRSTRLLKSDLHPASFYKNLWETVLSGAMWHGKLTNRKKDGSLYHEEMTIAPIRNQQGDVSHFIAFKQNITDPGSAELALQESAERLRMLLDSTAEAIYSINLRGNCTFCNSACARLLGYDSPADLLGKNMHTLIHHTRPDGTPYPVRECQIYQAFLKGEGIHVDDELLWRNDGSSFPAEYWSYPMRQGENVVGAAVTFLDITVRKKAQEALRESDAMFETLFESSPDATLATNQEGRILRINSQAEKVFGYNRAELLGEPIEILMPGRFRQAHRDKALAYHAQPRMRPMGEGMELWGKRKDGTEFPVEIMLSPLLTEKNKLVLSVIRDISARKKMEDALKQSENKFKTLFETANDAILIVNREKFVDCNFRAESLFRCGKESIVGRSPLDFSPLKQPSGRLSSEIAAEKIHAALTGQSQLFEWEHLRPDGTRFYAEVSLSRVLTPGAENLQGIVRDITERKETEKELQETHEQLKLALQESERQTQDAARLSELVDILQSCQNADEAYPITATALQGILRSAAGALYITSPSRDMMEMAASWGDIQDAEHSFRPDDCWALRRGKVHRAKDSASPLRCAHVDKSHANEYVCVPLAAQGETLGVLYVEKGFQPAGSAMEAGPDPMEFLERQATAVGERISLALTNLRLREVLRSQSIRDPLTGIFNRRFMEESLERELRRAARGKQKVAVLMLDIDHFKRFNDTFGHQAGDALLRSLGNLLKECTRGQDVVCRYGGEEFAFVLAGASHEAAQKRAELLREDIKQLHVHYGGQLLETVTVSIGVAVFPDNGDTAERLLKAADDALYRAKEQGRDRVVSA